MTTRQDRITGVMLGMAAGDALGVHYELGIPSHGKAQMLGGGYGFEPGEWSDDTQQALCVAAGGTDLDRVARELLAWFGSRPPDVGPTTSRVLGRVSLFYAGSPVSAAGMTEAARKVAQARGRAAGDISNGSLMRTAPVCLPLLGDRDGIAQAARAVSDLTHYDIYAGDACVLWSLAIDRAVALGDAFTCGEVCFGGIGHIPDSRREFWNVVCAEALGGASPPASNLNVVRAFQAALWAVAHSRDYEGGVQAAIAIGGDTDTIAAIAGGLLGAMHGAATIPDEWRRPLHGWSPAGRIWAGDLEKLAGKAARPVSAS